MNMPGVTQEMCAAFGASLAEQPKAASAVPAGAGGLLLLPYFQGERVPKLPEATGALAGIRPGLLRPAHRVRAALEGTMLSLALGIGLAMISEWARVARARTGGTTVRYGGDIISVAILKATWVAPAQAKMAGTTVQP